VKRGKSWRTAHTEDLPRGRFDDEGMGCGKTNGTEHAHRVFRKPYIRVADGTKEPLVEVAQSGRVVNHRIICDIVGKGVDREVTAEGILFRRAEDVVTENHSVPVLEVTGGTVSWIWLFRVCFIGGGGSPKRGDFQNFVLKVEMGQSKTAADETAVAKEPFDLTGCGVCGDVEVLGGSLQEQVADTPPDQVSNEAVVTESVERAQDIRTYLPSGYPVFLPGNDSWLHGLHHSTTGRKSKIPAAENPDMNPCGDRTGYTERKSLLSFTKSLLVV
jgi:hypothetical protein